MAADDVPIEGLLIGGRRVQAADGSVAPVHNPATGKVLAQVAQAGEPDIDAAVRAARDAYAGEWGAFGPGERAAALRRLAELVREHSEELAALETGNVGKPLSGSRGEVGYSAKVYEYYAGLIPVSGGRTVPLSAKGMGLTFREPIGVCGLIVPWNFPLVILAWKLAPALAMGNTVVIKPAEWTPLTALRLGELALAAGVPAGVVNVVPGLGPVAGAALVRHPGVGKVSFTGSTATGSKILEMAAPGIKRVSLELGGKSPSVVFGDADIEKAAGSVMSVYDNTGQDCCARSRWLVERSAYAEFVERFVENSRAVRRSGRSCRRLTVSASTASFSRDARRAQNCASAGARRLTTGLPPAATTRRRSSPTSPPTWRSHSRRSSVRSSLSCHSTAKTRRSALRTQLPTA
jgi:betaine-aldehyde dehydrogenase